MTSRFHRQIRQSIANLFAAWSTMHTPTDAVSDPRVRLVILAAVGVALVFQLRMMTRA